MASIKFPKGFLWGTSTAAAQIETASYHQWKGLKSDDGFIFDRTADHELRREEDAAIISRFGTLYRCGVDWSRLQRAPNMPFEEDVIKEYRDFFDDLRGRGMKIMFVLHHFTNPIWFEELGSWDNEKNIPFFLNYVHQCIDAFGDQVYLYNTFNEPGVYATNSFLMGNFPPKQKRFFKTIRVLKNMSRAHDLSYRILKEKDGEKWVGISKNNAWFEATNILGKPLAALADYFFVTWIADLFKEVDFIGLSYYAYIPLTPFPLTEVDTPGKLAAAGTPHDKMWGYRPEGFGHIMRRFYKKYQKPLIITENGMCTDDPAERVESIKDYLKVCKEVIDDGVDLRGYIHWSTFDNFEWSLGPTYRFGLMQTNFETMERVNTVAADFYEQVTKDNGFELEDEKIE